MMGTKMDLEPTADQSCSEPSSVKLIKDVRDDFLKRACAKLAARSLSELCSQHLSNVPEKSLERPFYQPTTVYPTRAQKYRTALAGWGQMSVVNCEEAAQTIS